MEYLVNTEKSKKISNKRKPEGSYDILRSILDNKEIPSVLNLSLTELLKKLQSENFNQTVKILILGLAISEILEEVKKSELKTLLDKISPSQNIKDKTEKFLQEQREYFIEKFKITDYDVLLIKKIVEKLPLKLFKDELGISPSKAFKDIKRLWKKLGLVNREQLIFVAGWMRLISPQLKCLKRKRLSE